MTIRRSHELLSNCVDQGCWLSYSALTVFIF